MIYTITLNPALDRELIVSGIAYDQIIRALEINIDFGGKGFNVSRMLKNLGVRTVALGFLGKDTGRKLVEGLKSLDIETDMVWIDEETRTNISIVSKQENRYIKVNENGPSVSLEKQNELLEKINALVKPDDWLVLAGSLPKNVASDFYAQVIRIVNSHHAKAFLDTSGAALTSGLLEKPFLIKPNVQEACEILGLPGENIMDIKALTARLRALGARNVVISMGADGALIQSDEGTWIAKSPKIVEKNPTGAGDSLIGGVLYGLSRGFRLQEALAWGAACGAVSASLPGTQMGSKEAVEAFVSKIVVEKV